MPRISSVLFRLALQTLITMLIAGGFSLTYGQTSPDYASITDVRMSGTGCPEHQAAVSLSPDFKDVSILFDNYNAEVGQGSSTPLTQLKATKDCQILVQIQVPDGWQMAFRAVDYRGFVALSTNSMAMQRFSIMQDGAPIVSMKEANLKGPMNQDYYVRAEVKPERLTWSPCLSGLTNVRLMSQITVHLNPRSGERPYNQIALDSADASVQQKLAVEWRRCSVSRPGRPAPSPIVTPPGSPRDPRDPPGVVPREPIRPPRYRGR